MSFIAKILQAFGFATADSGRGATGLGWVAWIKRLFARDDLAPLAPLDPQPVPGHGPAPNIAPTGTRYTPIRQALQERLQNFVCEDVPVHHEFDSNGVFLLVFIEILAEDNGKALLDQFFTEFSGKALITWATAQLAPTLGKGVSLDRFAGMGCKPSPMVTSDDKTFEDQLNGRSDSTYRVRLIGHWVDRPSPSAAQPMGATSSRSATRQAGPLVELRIRDSGGVPRSVQCGSYPAVLGKSSDSDIQISGHFVSAKHCTLYSHDHQIWLEDHSSNGTWLGAKQLEKGKKYPLTGEFTLGFGRAVSDTHTPGAADFNLHPQVEPLLLGRTPIVSPTSVFGDDGRTPLASVTTPTMPTTPATPLNTDDDVFAVLEIADAGGKSHMKIGSLPFSIGRAANQNYCVPDGNGGASREHLVIREITATGAQVWHGAHDKNGSTLGGVEMGENFRWGFGEELVLAARWKKHSPVRITLLPAAGKP